MTRTLFGKKSNTTLYFTMQIKEKKKRMQNTTHRVLIWRLGRFMISID